MINRDYSSIGNVAFRMREPTHRNGTEAISYESRAIHPTT